MLDIVVRIKFGSHLYGTATAASDLDYKSVYLPEAKEILLQRVRGSVASQRHKPEGGRNLPTDVDEESYALHRYLSLLSEGQTVAIDMFFAPEPEEASDLWRHIQTNKERLLTKKSIAFVGYCRQQANKYGIKGSRVAAAKQAAEMFQFYVEHFGPTLKVSDVLLENDEYANEHTHIVKKETTPGRSETYFECCNRMVGFHNTVKEAANIYSRIYEEYGDRARRAQANEGIDWKALSHAVRVGQEALELLTTGVVTFPLFQAAHLVQIKQGNLAYAAVAEEIEHLLAAIDEAAKTSTLRESSDREWIDSLVCDVYKGVVRR